MTDVALAHDILAARAGGERVLSALVDAFPGAPIHTLIHEPTATFAEFAQREIQTSWLNRSAWLRRNYRHAAPLAGPTYALKIIDADATICSTSGLSHHVRTTGAKIVYCHTPARWLHQGPTYLQGYSKTIQRATTLVRPAFARLDQWAMSSADKVVANSRQVAGEIADVYGIDAEVIAPCSTLDLTGPVEALAGVETGFVLTPARPLGYKRLDVLLAAARLLPDRQFLQIGEGPHREALVAAAPTNFTSVGSVSDAQLRWAYRNAEVVALTCAEDFGLVPLEAAAHGLPTIAPDARGLLDHDRSMLTTYEFAASADLADAIRTAPAPARELRPERLGKDQFMAKMHHIVTSLR